MLGVGMAGEELAGAACKSRNHQQELDVGLGIDIAGRAMKPLTCAMSYKSVLMKTRRLDRAVWLPGFPIIAAPRLSLGRSGPVACL